MASPSPYAPASPAPALGYLPSPQSPQAQQMPQTPGETKSLMTDADRSDEKLTSQPNFDNDGSKEQERALHSTAVKHWIYGLIIVAYLFATVFAIVHHVYLSSFDHHPIDDYSLNSQRWIVRVSNYFGKIVAFWLGLVATTALVQGVSRFLSLSILWFRTIFCIFICLYYFGLAPANMTVGME